jgi:tripartite-type tricarboxylate transporter receptor subunit TctC
LPVKSVKDLIAAAKERDKAYNYGSGSAGSGPHLAAELFKAMAGVELVRVPYKAFGVAINDLMAGDIQVAFPGPGLVLPQLNSGRLRVVAVTTAQPSALFPGIPTVAASGLPGYEFAQITGMFVPAGTPETIIKRLNEEIVRVLNRDEVKAKIFATGSEVVGNSPQQFAAAMKAEMTRLGKVIKDAGIKAD